MRTYTAHIHEIRCRSNCQRNRSLKDTVQPYNAFENTGNGFTFDRYESGLLYDAINRAKTLYFENRVYWDDMVVRDMNKDVSWEQSAKQYKDMYVELTPRY